MPNGWFVVDAHNQYVPREAVEKTIGTERDMTVSPYRLSLDMEAKLRMMDEAGIDMALIHMASSNYMGLDFCKAMNDGNARITREYPDRLIPLAHIPLDEATSPEGLKEIDRSIQELGLKGVALETTTYKYTLGSEELYPMYEKISRLNVPIVVHPANIKISRQIQGTGMKNAMLSPALLEYENTTACIEVMFGVLPRFPDLKFLLPHHGGALPIWQGRLKLTYVPEGFNIPDEYKNGPKTPRIREILGIDKPFDDILDKIHFDISGFGGWMPITNMALSIIGAERLCFGTDYGFEMNETADIKLFIDNIKALDIPEQSKRNILGENIRKLFNLQ